MGLIKDFISFLSGELTEGQKVCIEELAELIKTPADYAGVKSFRQVVNEIGGLAPILPPPTGVRYDN